MEGVLQRRAALMRLVSVNVGAPREIVSEGKAVRTGIFKQPVPGPVVLRRLNLDGDGQADLEVHGGTHQAAYVYPSEHYAFWRGQLPGADLDWGAFGENFTTEGLLEDSVNIGDTLRIGAALVRVTSPRLPCFKLGLRFGRPDIVRRFLESGRTGFYLMVTREGAVQAGDGIETVHRDPRGVRVSDMLRIYSRPSQDPELLQRLLQVETLSASWRSHFERHR